MDILIAKGPVSEEELHALAEAWHKTLVKGVVDVVTGQVALGGEWHMDANNRLIAEGSDQRNLWGFNLYSANHGADALEYISLINIRPLQGNFSMELEDETTRENIRKILALVVPHLAL